MSEQRLHYRFGPLERHGLLGPARTGQVATVGAGLVAAFGTLNRLPNAAGAALGIATVALSVCFTTLPLAGRTADQWLPLVVRFALRGPLRARVFRAQAPAAGWTRAAGLASRTGNGRRKRTRPPGLQGVELVELAPGGGSPGAIWERRSGRLTAVIACRAQGFTLLDPEAQERRLARWGSVLSAAADSGIRRLQWIERTAPSQGDELARWLHEARAPDWPARGVPIVESYLELISTSARVTNEHEILLAVQVDERRLQGRPRPQAREVLLEQTARLARQLEAAEVTVLGALRAGQLGRVFRTAFDPYARAELTARDLLSQDHEPLSASSPWPMAASEHWDHYRCDGACHATFWINAWPRVEVSPTFLEPLLGSSETVRTIAVSFEPVPPGRSTREVEAAITRDRADSELRRRFGQSETARQRQVQEAAMRREAELAAGHGEVRLTGFVTVSGRDPRELERVCTEVHQHAARARIELRRLYGQQAQAFTFTLPLARGLR